MLREISDWNIENFDFRNEGEWLRVTVMTKGSAIDLKIGSSFGMMGHLWTHCGEDVDWRAWLLDTDFSYFMNKTVGPSYRPFSLENTIEAVLEEAPWLEGEIPDDVGEEGLMTWLSGHMEDYWEMRREEDRPDLVRFWEVLWRPFIEAVQVG